LHSKEVAQPLPKNSTKPVQPCLAVHKRSKLQNRPKASPIKNSYFLAPIYFCLLIKYSVTTIPAKNGCLGFKLIAL
jgi:hypothetical protein